MYLKFVKIKVGLYIFFLHWNWFLLRPKYKIHFNYDIKHWSRIMWMRIWLPSRLRYPTFKVSGACIHTEKVICRYAILSIIESISYFINKFFTSIYSVYILFAFLLPSSFLTWKKCYEYQYRTFMIMHFFNLF